jgi:divalent metal cation (Fe/Co/Zn/Cd) transporter
MSYTCWSEPTAKHAYVLSWFSVVITALCCIAGILLYVVRIWSMVLFSLARELASSTVYYIMFQETGSALCLVFGVDNSVDFLTSVIVLWRFFVTGELTEAVEKKLQKREERASVAISIIMVLLGLSIIIAAIDDFLAGWSEPSHRELILGLATTSIVTSGTMAVFKFRYSTALCSPSLYKDGLCSLLGATLGAALFFNTLIQDSMPGLWWIDPVVSMLCGILASIYAAYTIYIALAVDKLHIFSKHFWYDDIEAGGDGNTPAEDKPKESEVV